MVEAETVRYYCARRRSKQAVVAGENGAGMPLQRKCMQSTFRCARRRGVAGSPGWNSESYSQQKMLLSNLMECLYVFVSRTLPK